MAEIFDETRAEGNPGKKYPELSPTNPTVSTPPRISYIVTLRPEPHCVDSTRALRRALKVLLRRFGLSCVEFSEAVR
jgi:hypothetical protein